MWEQFAAANPPANPAIPHRTTLSTTRNHPKQQVSRCAGRPNPDNPPNARRRCPEVIAQRDSQPVFGAREPLPHPRAPGRNRDPRRRKRSSPQRTAGSSGSRCAGPPLEGLVPLVERLLPPLERLRSPPRIALSPPRVAVSPQGIFDWVRGNAVSRGGKPSCDEGRSTGAAQ